MKYCLGTVQFGLNYGIQNNGKPSEDLVNKLLQTALSNNIDMLDTAAAYGDSEIILGKFLAQCSNNKAKVISKISSEVLNNLDNNASTSALRKGIEESLKRLQVSKLYGLLYHDSRVVDLEDRVNLLIRTKESNLVEKVGISIYSPEEALKAINYNIDIIQVPYNIFDDRLSKVGFFAKAKEKNIEIYARSPLLQGLALMDYNNLPENVLFAKAYVKKFDDICRKYGVDRLFAAVNYVASNEYIDYIVFGVDNMDQLQQYLSIRDGDLPKKFIEEIKNEFNEVPEKLVNPVLWK